MHTQVCSPEDMVGFTESAKCAMIRKIFDDAYRFISISGLTSRYCYACLRISKYEQTNIIPFLTPKV